MRRPNMAVKLPAALSRRVLAHVPRQAVPQLTAGVRRRSGAP